MKLAVCVTPEQRCPPIDYGGNEMQADILARKLRAYTQAEADGLSKLDHELFVKRMTEYGIRVAE